MEKVKEFFKRYLIGFITGIVVCGGVSVIAATYFPSNQVTYENAASGMKATDVQGAIDELYNICFLPKTGGDAILDDVDIVNSGDGLYKDEYEDGKYTYKGANPNNYVTFNNEKAGWRIISINSDGTIKIMRDASIGDMVWDSSNSNNWARPASLNTYLNSTYYNSLNSTAKSQIVVKDFGIGAVTSANNNLRTQIKDENSVKWNGKVALATASEYIRSNSNQSSCGNMNQLWTSSSCGDTTWMYNGINWWMLSSDSMYSYSVYFVISNGNIGHSFNSNNIKYAVRPIIYLSSSVQITGGDGSKSNPYIIE